jgi:hypothetical protein
MRMKIYKSGASQSSSPHEKFADANIILHGRGDFFLASARTLFSLSCWCAARLVLAGERERALLCVCLSTNVINNSRALITPADVVCTHNGRRKYSTFLFN